ncbi:RNA polymerase sigma factor [Streptomyces sp. R44]|uniref:RNA polymerase sigma factor n=1 Tax=Streptomyces sp. R44 TaxID=3238633 RepID=A0AB39T5R5_9ACTN
MDRTQVTDTLITAAQGGDRDAMWQIVSAYEGVLVSTVRAVASTATPDQFDDLLQEARAILIQHVHAFEVKTTSAQLSTFAHRAVRRGVATEWVKMTTGLTIEPSAALAVRRALHQTEGDVEGAWMIVGSDHDPRRRMSRETFVAILEALEGTDSLDAPAGGDEDGGVTVGDALPDPEGDFTTDAQRRTLARFLLGQIANRQAFALRAFYGIGMSQMADQEAALDMGVSTIRVRTLRADGIKSARRVANVHGIAA